MKLQHFIPAFMTTLLIVAPIATGQGQFTSTKEIHPQTYAVGGNFGLTLYSGDIDHGGLFPDADHKWVVGGDIFVQMKMFTGGKLVYGSFVAILSYSPQKAVAAEYEFITRLISLSGMAKIEFFTRSPFRPYAAGGLGVAFFDPAVTTYSKRAAEYAALYRGESRIALILPISIGILWTVTKQIDITYQFTKTLAFSDNLDGWEAKDRDNYQTISIGAIYYF